MGGNLGKASVVQGRCWSAWHALCFNAAVKSWPDLLHFYVVYWSTMFWDPDRSVIYCAVFLFIHRTAFPVTFLLEIAAFYLSSCLIISAMPQYDAVCGTSHRRACSESIKTAMQRSCVDVDFLCWISDIWAVASFVHWTNFTLFHCNLLHLSDFWILWGADDMFIWINQSSDFITPRDFWCVLFK